MTNLKKILITLPDATLKKHSRMASIKGRTIRKVMGGGGGGRGIFSSHDFFFFSPSACAGIFLQVKLSALIFFFREILLCLSFTN